MYEIYQKLLDEKKLKNSDVSRATGISNMTLSDWKRGKTKPKIDKLQLIADYFNVSVDYLMTGKDVYELGKNDAILTSLSDRVIDYAVKMSKLSDEDMDYITYMIDKIIEKRNILD